MVGKPARLKGGVPLVLSKQVKDLCELFKMQMSTPYV